MKIRPYEAKDRERVRMICHKTATDEEYIKNPDLVAALYAEYYIDYEPQNAFILANDNDEAIGYILCAQNYKTYIKNCKKLQLPKIRKLSRKWAFIARLGFLSERMDGKKYPAHLHIDILEEGQRQGFGTKLMDTLLQHLRQNGVKGVKLGVGGTNQKGISFYKKYGFLMVHNFGSSGIVFGMKL